MARRAPRPAATTSTLARNPDLDAAVEPLDEGASDEEFVHDEHRVHPAAGEAAMADLAEQGTAALAAASRQLPVPGTEAPAPMASHPPPDEMPKRRGPGRPRAPRPDVAPAPAVVQAPVASAVELTDEELLDLGALARMACKLRLPLEALAPELERMLAAYRKAQL